MKNLLSKLQFRRHKTVPEVLQSIIGKERLQQVINLSDDRREYIPLAADLCDIAESELAAQVSKKLGYRYTPHVQPMDLSRLPPEITIEHYEMAGVIFDTSGERVNKVICCDPVLMHQLLDGTSTLHCSISSWTEIRAALRASMDTASSGTTASQDENSLMAKKVVQYIFGSALKKDAHQVFIDLSLANPNYYYLNDAGEKEYGQITPLIVEPIANYLTFAEDCVLTLDTHKVSLEYEEGCSDKVCLSLITPENTERGSQVDLSNAPQILVVDDSQSYSAIIRNTLSNEGYEVQEVASCEAALDLLNELTTPPSLIISDLNLSGMPGDTFIKTIRDSDKWSNLPIIAMTSDSEVENEIQLINCGADAFIGKEKDLRLLLAQANRLLTRHNLPRAA